MLSDNCFASQISRLVETYGEKNFPQPRVNLLRKEMNHLSDEQFDKVVGYVIFNKYRIPSGDDFYKAVDYVKKQTLAEENRAKVHVRVDPFADIADEMEYVHTEIQCEHCFDTGTITAISRKTRNDYLFRCFCEVGERRPEIDGPIFKKDFFKSYLLPKPQSSPSKEELKQLMVESEVKWRQAQIDRVKSGFSGPTFSLRYDLLKQKKD